MDIAAILTTQLLDPFRIGLIVMLMVTAARTGATTGTWTPLVLGVLFVAVIIPSTIGAERDDRTAQIAVGLVSNAIILAILLAAKAAYAALTRPRT